jgi:ferritin-like metal-binding protein YciE
MPVVTLRDLYTAELQDLFDVEQQIISAFPELSEAATSADLRAALLEHLEQTHVQLQRLEFLLRKLDVPSSGEPCEAIRGLIAEGRRRIATIERGVVRDAALIGAVQRIEHYEIAAYGTARTHAEMLGYTKAAKLLQQTLDEEGATDKKLTALAESIINVEAVEA